MDYDVIVVGAGPGGASAARACADEGLKVALLEKHLEPGMKVCAGGVDQRIVRDFDIDDAAIQRHIERNCLYSPSGKCATEKTKSATVNRSDFDSYLASRAVDAGAALFTSTGCQGILKDGDSVVGVSAKTPEGLRKFAGKVVIGADGFNSIIARSAGLMPRYGASDVALTAQRDVYVEGAIEDDAKHFFYGDDVSTCGFGWIYPKKSCYTVGLGTLLSHVERGRLNRNLEYLINEHPIASEILSGMKSQSHIQAACIPIRLSSKLCANGLLLVGDAGGQVSPLGGNGIYYAMNAGVLAGKVIADALAKEDVSEEELRKYGTEFFSTYGKELLEQKRLLETVKNHFGLYMEARIFLDRHTMLRRAYISGRVLAKPLSAFRK